MNQNRYLKILNRYDSSLYKASIKTYQEYKREIHPMLSTLSACIAPIIYLYTDWVIHESLQKGIKRLYFLARDSYIFYHTAILICQEKHLEIECKYLYCSRIAWRIPSYHLFGQECIDFICIKSMDMTMATIMERSGLTIEKQKQVLQQIGFPIENINDILTQEDIVSLKSKLSNCNLFLDFVYQNSKICYHNTIGYLEQEGLLEDISMALVDTGWTGSMQKTLKKLLGTKTSKNNIQGFYFGMYHLPLNCNKEDYHTFYFNKNTGFLRKLNFNNNLFEAICCAPTGMTIGYYKNSKYIPIFSHSENLNFNQFDISTHHKIILTFIKNMLIGNKKQPNNLSHSKRIQITKKLLQQLMVFPTVSEAEFYGSFLFSDNTSETFTIQLAPTLLEHELQEIDFIPKIKKRFLHKIIDNKSFWIEGSITRSQSSKKRWHILNAKLWESSIILYSSLINLKRRFFKI